MVTSADFDGSTLLVNGQPTSFQISGVPAGDTFFFTNDSHGGTNLTMEAVPVVTIDKISDDGFINDAEANSGVTISGTAFDTSISLYHHSITVNVVNSLGRYGP